MFITPRDSSTDTTGDEACRIGALSALRAMFDMYSTCNLQNCNLAISGREEAILFTNDPFYFLGIILVHDLTNKKSSQNLYRWSLEALNRDVVPSGVVVTNGWVLSLLNQSPSCLVSFFSVISRDISTLRIRRDDRNYKFKSCATKHVLVQLSSCTTLHGKFTVFAEFSCTASEVVVGRFSKEFAMTGWLKFILYTSNINNDSEPQVWKQ